MDIVRSREKVWNDCVERNQESYQEGNRNILEPLKDSHEIEQQEWWCTQLPYFSYFDTPGQGWREPEWKTGTPWNDFPWQLGLGEKQKSLKFSVVSMRE